MQGSDSCVSRPGLTHVDLPKVWKTRNSDACSHALGSENAVTSHPPVVTHSSQTCAYSCDHFYLSSFDLTVLSECPITMAFARSLSPWWSMNFFCIIFVCEPGLLGYWERHCVCVRQRERERERERERSVHSADLRSGNALYLCFCLYA